MTKGRPIRAIVAVASLSALLGTAACTSSTNQASPGNAGSG